MKLMLPFLFGLLAFSSNACQPCEFPEREAKRLRTERFGEHGDFRREADRLAIYSLASNRMSKLPKQAPTAETFQEFQIYGMVETANKSEIPSVWSDLHQRIDSIQAQRIAYCLWPRHGIRAYHGQIARD